MNARRPAAARLLAVLAAGAAAATAVAVLAAPPPAAAAPPDYEIRLAAEVDAEVGRTETVSLTIVPAPGWRVDDDGPLLVRLAADPADAVDLPRRRYQRRDAADARADSPRFDLRYTGRVAGDHRLLVTTRFWLCRRHACRPIRDERSVGVHARPPAPPPPTPNDAGVVAPPAPPPPPPPAAPPR